MASKYTHDVVATTGEYTNGQGEKKKEYTNVGKAFTDDQGRVSIKLKTVPVGPEWSGWLSLYEAKPKDGPRDPQGARSPEHGQREAPRNSGHGMPAAPTPAADYQEDDDIPF